MGTGKTTVLDGASLSLKVYFTGVTLKVIGKIKIMKEKSSSQSSINFKKNIIKRKDGILKTNEFYVL